MRHFVHGALAPANPLVRIGIIGVVHRVVVPRGDVQHGACRQDRSRIIGIDVIGHPIKIEVVHVADHLRAAVRQNRFHGHCLPAKVHVRLEVSQNRRMFQHVETLCLFDCVRWNIQRKLSIHRRVRRVRHQVGPIFRFLPFRIEVDGQLRMRCDRFAHRMKVQLPPDVRTRKQQLARVRTVDVVVLSDGPLHQHARAVAIGIVAGEKRLA